MTYFKTELRISYRIKFVAAQKLHIILNKTVLNFAPRQKFIYVCTIENPNSSLQGIGYQPQKNFGNREMNSFVSDYCLFIGLCSLQSPQLRKIFKACAFQSTHSRPVFLRDLPIRVRSACNVLFFNAESFSLFYSNYRLHQLFV